MSTSLYDVEYENHLEDEKINELRKEWLVLEKEIKFDDSEKDNIKITRLREIEDDFDLYVKSRSSELIEKLQWLNTWSPLSKEEKLKIQETQGGRPIDIYHEQKKLRLRKRYYKLRDKLGHNKAKCLEVLSKEFGWAETTVETYLKR